MRSAFDIVRESKEERRDLSKGDIAQGITQASLAQWGMGKGNHPPDVLHKQGDREEDKDITALMLENAILKAEVDGLRATVAVLTTATRHLPCLRCGESRAAPEDEALKTQEAHSLPTGSVSMAWSTPTRPPEESGNHSTDGHSACDVEPAPAHPSPETTTGGWGQAQPTGSAQHVRSAESSHQSASVAPVCAPAPARVSSSQLGDGDDSRTESAQRIKVQGPLDAQVPGPMLESGACSKRYSKSPVRTASPSEPDRCRLTTPRTDFCAKCWPLLTTSTLPKTAREAGSQEMSWSQSFAKHTRGKGKQSIGNRSTFVCRKSRQPRARSLQGHAEPENSDEIREPARVSINRACRDICSRESRGKHLAVEPRPAPVLQFHGNMKDIDEDEKFSHCTMCAMCGLSPPEGNPLSLCRGCPRIFCSKCLPKKCRGAKPVKCPRCPGDEHLPPAPPDVEPMMHLLEELIEHDLSHSFRKHPEYMTTAVRSMNLGTMMDKLKSGKYSGRRAWGHFQKDCGLIWENCRYYNDCDELGLPEEGTVIPGVVRCALVLEAMARKFYLPYLPNQNDSGAEKPLGSSPMDLQTWDTHRQKVQQAKAEERLKQVAGSQHRCSNRTAAGAVSRGDICSASESTTGHSGAIASDTTRGKEKYEDFNFKQTGNKRRDRAGKISTDYGLASQGKQRAGRREVMVDGMQRTKSCDRPNRSNRSWNGVESGTSCDHVPQKGSTDEVAGPGCRADPSQVDQRALQPSRSVKGPSTGTDSWTTEATTTCKRLSSFAQPAPAKRTKWILLDQLGDVAYGFPKKRNK